MTTRYARVSDDQIALTSTPRPPFLPRLTTALLSAALTLAASQALAGGAGGGGDNPGGKGGGWENQGNGENIDPNDGKATVSDLSANTVREFTTITHGGVGGTSPTFGGGGGGAAAYFGGANATITVRSNLLGGSGWVGYSSTDGSGGGGDGLIVMDGKVNVTATGQLVGGDATYSMGGRPGSGGAALYLDKGTIQNAGLIVGGTGGYNNGAAPSGIAPGGNGGDGAVLRNGRMVNEGRITGGEGGMSMTPNSRGGNGGNGVVIMAGSNTPRLPGSALGLPDLVNRGQITGGNAANNSDYPSPYHSGTSGAGVVAKDNVYIVNYGTITAGGDGSGANGVAVRLTGDGNRLELANGSSIMGHILSTGRNTLALNSADGKPTTASMTGDLYLGPGDTFEVRATPTAADRLDVNGKAQIHGTVSVVAGTGTYAESTRYTILTAQTLSNKFMSTTSNLAYLKPTVANEGNTVVLTLALRQAPKPDPDPDPVTPTRPIRFEDLADTSNQRAAARGVQSLPASNPLYQAVLNLPVGAPAPTFTALSGETHASNAASLRNVANTSAMLPLEHFRSNMTAALLPGQPSAAAGASDAVPDAATLPGSTVRPVWAQVIGNWQRASATDNTAEVRQHTGGLFMGADRPLGGGWRMGGAVGYTDSRARADAVDSKADISNYSLTLYAGKSFEAGAGKLNFLAGGAYTWHDLSTERMVRIGGGTQKLQADYGASTAQLFTELGYAMRVSPALTLEPYAGLIWSDQRIRGFSESGGYAALSGQSQRNALTTTTLGLRGRQDIMLGSISAALRAGLGWRHTFGDVQPSTTMAFAGGDSFSVTGAPIARNAALVELGLDGNLSRSTTLAVGYSGQFGSGNRDQTASMTLRWKF
ncbi:autotransporter outer membrane beta-barrel domain-containing protein [Achromobacter sp. AONIH1]|uniref:autotransporter family protein n=1 Tax=Achromobacter sp. AONIH1 TaxID=1758194 RepID=UPI000CD1FA69|nr:autotransporter outer membrane beta-barrel domain-containing protein [Achromobacter sp. AONIH1]AUT45802.1 autotransporter outer membrane beta-barrel domain-containing protein [Achromobacter sp. AONIH1]